MKSMIIVLSTACALFAIRAPENLEAVGGDQIIDLTWDAVDSAASYRIYQLDEAANYNLIGSTSLTEATVQGFTEGEEGCFAVTASDGQGGCEFDFTEYGSASCDTAWDEYGIDCATLTANYGWDCAGCECPGDVSCSEQGLIECFDGSCAATEADCPVPLYDCSGTAFAETYLSWVGDTYCDQGDGSYNPDLNFNCEEYDFDGGDCVTCEEQGQVTCFDGSCAATEADCPLPLLDCDGTEFAEAFLSWIGDSYCDDGTDQGWTPILNLNCEEYDFDGGDCGTQPFASNNSGPANKTHTKDLILYNVPDGVLAQPFITREESGYSDVACAVASSCETAGSGDVNGDGSTNVLDIVSMVNFILGVDVYDDCQLLSADINGDGAGNVLDIVAIVNVILDGRSADASSARIINESGRVSVIADGFVGAVQMKLSHGSDFAIELTDKAMVAKSVTRGNTTTIIVVSPYENQIFTSGGEFAISEMIVANSSSEIDVVMADKFSLMAAYPNPFNPTTTLSLNVPQSGFVSVKVFNLMGSVVATLAEGNMDANSYNFTWDASQVSSGVYLVRAESAGQISTQKLMLLK